MFTLLTFGCPSYNSFVCYANVSNSLMCYINLKYIWANYVLLKPGVYTPTLKKHQVVRDLKKFENHCLRQTPVSNLCGRTSFRLSQHEKFFVVYLGNEMSLTVYLSITDSFFLWRSQRKRLVYVGAIFVSVDVPMLYTLSLLTRFIPTKPMAVTQLPFSINRWIPFFRTTNENIVFSANDHSIVCYHTRFCFRRCFEKSGHKPHENVLQPWQTNVWRSKMFA